MSETCGPSRHTTIAVDIGGHQVFARVAHRGELSEQDRAALAAAVRGAVDLFQKREEHLLLFGADS